MRYIFLIFLAALFTYTFGSDKAALTDGMYLVVDEIKKGAENPALNNPFHTIVDCSFHYKENDDSGTEKVVVDTSDYVPLVLQYKPNIEKQSDDRKKIEISLTKSASEKLTAFTTSNVQKRVALVIGNEIISMHQIKVPITSGQLQISYCGNDMCEILQSKLIKNVDSSNVKTK